jgi:hypothetical protein
MEKEKKLPMTMLLQRKAIRLYPDGVSVGIYYSKDLDQYFAVTARGQTINNSISEEEDV